MRKHSDRSPEVAAKTQDHFRKAASSFDGLYGGERPPFLQRLLRPALFGRQVFALSVIQSLNNPRVLDVGCGSGRFGELAFEAGAGEYVGIDFSEPMLEIAREKLQRFSGKVQLVQGDYLHEQLDGEFDVIVGLGLFDYLPEPELFTRRMRSHCRGSVVASFPRWTLVKGPMRKIRYEVINNCPIFNYTERELRFLFGASGFREVHVERPVRSGFWVRARV